MRKNILMLLLALTSGAAGAADLQPAAATNSASTNKPVRPDYILVANDVVHVKVYQEDDLEAKVRVSKDGSVVLSLLGSVTIGGKTREQAAKHIRDLLGDKYLVNPHVSLEILEYSKHRFTVLGQVQRPATYDMPGDESVNLLQALSMAGGLTRLGAGSRVTVQRGQGTDKQVFKLDADAMAKDKDAKVFEVLPDDTITVGEKIF